MFMNKRALLAASVSSIAMIAGLSIAEPDNMGYLRAALAMDMLGAKGEDFRSWQGDIRLWENRLARIREYESRTVATVEADAELLVDVGSKPAELY